MSWNDWTSAIGNVRVQFQKLDKLGYDAALNEHATAGHGIRTPPPKTTDWLFRLKRDSHPTRIVYSCEHPRDGKAYWIEIRGFVDPHAVARIEATVRKTSSSSNDMSTSRPLEPSDGPSTPASWSWSTILAARP